MSKDEISPLIRMHKLNSHSDGDALSGLLKKRAVDESRGDDEDTKSTLSDQSKTKAIKVDSATLAKTFNETAIMCENKGDYDEAIVSFKKVLSLSQEENGEDHFNTADSYRNIGIMFDAKGEFDEAISFYKKAVGIYEKVLGKAHPKTIETYNNMGMLYDSKGDHDEAEAFYNKI